MFIRHFAMAAILIGLGSGAASAASVYLNHTNITVSVGPGTGAGTANNTYDYGFGIEKVIDAPSADAEEYHTQASHIWYTFDDPSEGLELIFDFSISYDITALHFWNYTGETYDVDQVDFSFYNSIGDLIGTQTLFPALGSSPGILAETVEFFSPLNTRQVIAYLTGTNGQIDFQNIGFTANISDPTLDPEQPAPIPLPATAWLLLAGAGAFGSLRLRRRR